MTGLGKARRRPITPRKPLLFEVPYRLRADSVKDLTIRKPLREMLTVWPNARARLVEGRRRGTAGGCHV